MFTTYSNGPQAGYSGYWSLGPLTVFKSTDGSLYFHMR